MSDLDTTADTAAGGAEPPHAEESLPPHRRTHPESYDRTWELELLISGAVAFTLLQLPSAVDSGFERLAPRLGPALHQVTVFAYIYLKIILYALISSFIVHLAARAYWVGLVGLTSVFPRGVRWERTMYGPVSKEFYQERIPSLQAQTAAVDRFCSILFSFATVIVLTFVSSTVIVTVLAAASWLISDRLLPGVDDMWVFQSIMALIIIPMILASQIDKRWGDRLGRRGKGAVRGVLRLMWFTQLGTLTTAISNTLFSNINRVKSVGLFYFAFAALLGFFIVRDVMIRMGGAAPDGYAYLPENNGVLSVDYRYYEDQHPEGRVIARIPTIQSDMIQGPFVRLFLPYIPRRHNALVEARCPGLAAEPRAASEQRLATERRDQAMLDCLSAIQPMQLNGEPLQGVRFHHYVQPGSELEGIIAYIPTTGLPAGENLLLIEPVPRPEADGDSDADPQRPHHIRFWIGE